MLKIGDKVVMNNKYYVANKNKGVVFTVNSKPFDLCGTECVMLEGYSGGYAADGLSIVNEDWTEPRFLLDEDSTCYGCQYYVSVDDPEKSIEKKNILRGGICDCNVPCIGGNMNGYRMND